jgi:hypothetical protein
VHHLRGQGGAAAGFAVQHHAQVAVGQIRTGAEFEFQQAARSVDGSWQMPGGKLIGYPPFKKFANRLFHGIVCSLLDIPSKDLTNNFKLMRTESGELVTTRKTAAMSYPDVLQTVFTMGKMINVQTFDEIRERAKI